MPTGNKKEETGRVGSAHTDAEQFQHQLASENQQQTVQENPAPREPYRAMPEKDGLFSPPMKNIEAQRLMEQRSALYARIGTENSRQMDAVLRRAAGSYEKTAKALEQGKDPLLLLLNAKGGPTPDYLNMKMAEILIHERQKAEDYRARELQRKRQQGDPREITYNDVLSAACEELILDLRLQRRSGQPLTYEAAMALVHSVRPSEKAAEKPQEQIVQEKAEQEKADREAAEKLQKEEENKAAENAQSGEAAHEDSKKVQGGKEQLDKAAEALTEEAREEDKAAREQIEQEKTDRELAEKLQKEEEKKAAENAPSDEAAREEDKEAQAEKETIDAAPFVNAVSDISNLIDTGEGLREQEYKDMQGALDDFVAGYGTTTGRMPMAAGGTGKLPVILDTFRKHFQGIADKAQKMQKKLVEKVKLGRSDWSALKKANSVHALGSLLDKGIAPNSEEGMKTMLAAKIAHGGSLSFTDGKEFACNSDSFMKTVDLICKSPSFKEFTKGRSVKELDQLMSMKDDGIFKDFVKQMEMTRAKKMEAAKTQEDVKEREVPMPVRESPKKKKGMVM